jgi:regulator of CtrA degradation
LLEARNYFAYGEGSRLPPGPYERLLCNYHALRMTSRLTQVMAWMMAQRAWLAGEMSPEQACGGQFSLGGEKVCVDGGGPEDERLPGGLRDLLERSHNMYMRVWRLDQASRDKFSQA